MNFIPLTRATADVLLDDIQSLVQQRAATLDDRDFRAWFASEESAVIAMTQAMHRAYVDERIGRILASVGKSPI